MGSFVISLLITITIVTIFVWLDGWDDELIFLGFFIALGSMLFFVILSFAFETEPTKLEEISIYALKDNNSVQGEFFLATGYVDEKMYYFYTTKDEEGFLQINKVSVDDGKIKETDISEPKVIVYGERYKSKFARFMFGEFNNEKVYKFIVPKNTVTTEFNVDLE